VTQDVAIPAAEADDLRRLNAATDHLEPPFAVIDLEAFRSNAADMARRAAGTPIRLASKSVRCRRLIEDALAADGFRGILAFTLPEALWLAESKVSDDIVVAYPTADMTALAKLASHPQAALAVTVMTDSIDHLDLIARAAATVPEPQQIRVAIDIDAGYLALGGKLRAGALRSPIRAAAQAAALARAIVSRPGLKLAGIMAYEAQIAGVGDNPPGRPGYARAIRVMQARSAAELARRRAAIVAAVRAVAPLEFVNGGGTGSSHRRRPSPRSPRSAQAPACTSRCCSTPTPRSRAPQQRCSRCPWCAAPVRASQPSWAAATSRPGRATRAGCRGRTCQPG
jgi:D-serine deaminase-like pyridoxal phosphate-dependent protein